jgi:hypothetical protein
MPVISGGTIIEGASARPISNAGAPTSGTSGTGAGSAPKGSLLNDTTNGVLYMNTGTQASPTWTEVPSLLAGGITSAELMAATVAPRLRVYQETVTRAGMTDGGATVGTKDLSISIPAGAVYARTLITAITGFTGDTSAAMTLGDGTDVDRYNTGTPDLFTTAAAGVDAGVPSGTLFHSAAKTPKLTITSTADFTNVAAGSVTLTLFWYEAV